MCNRTVEIMPKHSEHVLGPKYSPLTNGTTLAAPATAASGSIRTATGRSPAWVIEAHRRAMHSPAAEVSQARRGATRISSARQYARSSSFGRAAVRGDADPRALDGVPGRGPAIRVVRRAALRLGVTRPLRQDVSHFSWRRFFDFGLAQEEADQGIQRLAVAAGAVVAPVPADNGHTPARQHAAASAVPHLGHGRQGAGGLPDRRSHTPTHTQTHTHQTQKNKKNKQRYSWCRSRGSP